MTYICSLPGSLTCPAQVLEEFNVDLLLQPLQHCRTYVAWLHPMLSSLLISARTRSVAAAVLNVCGMAGCAASMQRGSWIT